ncbi:MAG: hypothetical protein KDD11_09980 [Acidobacteria bacterium]|nr:hypothetical protein [Acidobacteriota bacterium]
MSNLTRSISLIVLVFALVALAGPVLAADQAVPAPAQIQAVAAPDGGSTEFTLEDGQMLPVGVQDPTPVYICPDPGACTRDFDCELTETPAMCPGQNATRVCMGASGACTGTCVCC